MFYNKTSFVTAFMFVLLSITLYNIITGLS